MKELEKLLDRIIQRVNINLREIEYDVNPLVRNLIPPNQMTKFYAFYGITPHHPLNFQFKHSNLSGSYFLGKCSVTNSLLYKSDILSLIHISEPTRQYCQSRMPSSA